MSSVHKAILNEPTLEWYVNCPFCHKRLSVSVGTPFDATVLCNECYSLLVAYDRVDERRQGRPQ